MDDLIRRQAAIEDLNRLAREKFSLRDEFQYYLNALIDAEDEIKALPSAQPEITAEQVKEFCEERGWVVLTKEEFHWLKSLHENSRLNGGGNY